MHVSSLAIRMSGEEPALRTGRTALDSSNLYLHISEYHFHGQRGIWNMWGLRSAMTRQFLVISSCITDMWAFIWEMDRL